MNYAYITVSNPSSTAAIPVNAVVRVTIPAYLYKQYLACDLSNAGFAWDNGTTTGISSMLDGNVTNPMDVQRALH